MPQDNEPPLHDPPATPHDSARRPTFMGGGDLGAAVRAVFPTVPLSQSHPVRAPAVRGVVKRAQAPTIAETAAPLDAATLATATPPPEPPPDPDPEPEPAQFGGEDREAEAQGMDLPPQAAATAMPAEFMSSPALAPSPAAVDYAERLSAGVAALRLTSERLAEQARSDALELALLVSRRILEAELSTNVDRFFGVIRSVIRRAGESQRVVVRLHPEDAARVEAAGGARSLGAMAVAQVEIVGDRELELGDCVVEADFGTVDGRLGTRLEEMRRLLLEAMATEES